MLSLTSFKRLGQMGTEIKIGAILTAIKKYDAANSDELSFELNDLIEVDSIPLNKPEMAHGINRSWGLSNGKQGLFPLNYVRIESKEAQRKDSLLPIIIESHQESPVADIGASNIPLPRTDLSRTESHEDSPNFQIVIERSASIKSRNSDNAVEISSDHKSSASESLSNSPTTAVNADMPDILSLSRKTMSCKTINEPNATWQDFVDPARIAALTPKEKQKQTAIWELIYTERDYVRDLKMVIDAFENPLIDRKILRAKDVEKVFTNIDALYQVNNDFLGYLEERLQIQGIIENVGDLFVKLGEKLICYTMYCSNQTQAIAKLQQHITSNKAVKQFLDEVYKTNITRQLDLASFLLKPIQRICKYPLLLKEIIKYTDPASSDFIQLQEGQEKLQAIIHIVNEGARQHEGTRKILDIQNNFTEKLNFVTSNRYLVREDDFPLMIGGSSKKEKARKVFLFNDLIILARKDWRDKLHLIEKASLRDCRVCDVQSDDESSSQGEFYFELEIGQQDDGSRENLNANKSQYIFICKSAGIKKGWIDAYKILTELKVKHKYLSDVNKVPQVDSTSTVLTADGSDDDEGESKAKKGKEEKKIKEKEKEWENKAIELSGKIQELDLRIQELQTKNSELENASLIIKESEKQNIHQISELIEELNKTKEIKLKLESEVNDREISVERIKRDLEVQSKNAQELQSVEIESLNNKIDELKTNQSMQLKTADKKFADLKAVVELEKQHYENKIEQLNYQIESLTAQRKETQEKINSIKSQKNETSIASTAMYQSRIKELEDSLEKFASDVLCKDASLKEKATIISKLEGSYEILSTSSIELKTQYESLLQSHKLTKSELERLLAERSGSDLNKSIRMKELQDALQSEQKNCESLRKDIQSLHSDISKLKSESSKNIQSRSEDIQSFKLKLDEALQTISTLEATQKNTLLKLRDETARKKQIQVDASGIKAELEELKASFSLQETKVTELIKEKTEYGASIAYHMNQVELAQSETSIIQSKLAEQSAFYTQKFELVNAENIRLKTKCNELIQALQEAREQIQAIKDIEMIVEPIAPRSRQGTCSAEDSAFQKTIEDDAKQKIEKIQIELISLAQSINEKSSKESGDFYKEIQKMSTEYQQIINDLSKKTTKKLLKERQANQDRKQEIYQQYQAHVSALSQDIAVKEEQTKAYVSKLCDRNDALSKKCQDYSKKIISANENIKSLSKSMQFKSSQLIKAKVFISKRAKLEKEKQIDMEIRFSNICGKKLTSWQELEVIIIEYVTEIKRLKSLLDSKRIKCRELEFLCKTNIEHSKVASDIIKDAQEFAKHQMEKVMQENEQKQFELVQRNEDMALKLQRETDIFAAQVQDFEDQMRNMEATIKYQRAQATETENILKLMHQTINEKERTIIELSSAIDNQRYQIDSVQVKLSEESDIRQFCDYELKALRKEFFQTKKTLDAKTQYVNELKSCIISLKNDTDLYLT